MFDLRLKFFCYAFLTFVFCGALFAQAETGESSSLQGWHKTRAEIFAQIEQEVKAQAEATVTLEKAAANLEIQLPAAEPEKTAQEISAETRQAAEKTALATKSLKELQTIVAEAERIYPLYQVGDQVSIRTRIKAYPLATGIVTDISPERVRIGSRWIPVRDIAEEQRNGFDSGKTRNLRQNYITRQNNLQMAILSNATDEIFRKTFPENMRKHGYYPDSDEPTELLKLENWSSASSALQRELAILRKDAASKLRPDVEKRLFTEKRFKYYENKKEWRPAGVLQSLKNLFD